MIVPCNTSSFNGLKSTNLTSTYRAVSKGAKEITHDVLQISSPIHNDAVIGLEGQHFHAVPLFF